MKRREERYNCIEINDDLGRVYEKNATTYDLSRIKGRTLSMEKHTRESLIRIFPQTPCWCQS